MAVSLSKGQGVSLSKAANDLSQITIGLGWDVSEPKRGLFGTLFGAKQEDYDLDAIAFLLGADGTFTAPDDVVFYNEMRHASGAVWLTGDNRTGDGDGDDEQIIVNLDRLPQKYARIVFVVSIYQGRQKNQDFGKVANAFIRAVDGKGKEMARFDISGEAALARHCSLTFAEVVRGGDGWKFNAIGTPHATDRFVDLMQAYVA
jgi:stress response protein SCP2